MMFSYTPKNHVSYTIKEFSATRFGSHRQRPDHDVMKRIQRQAASRGNATVRSHGADAGDGPDVKPTVLSSRTSFNRASPTPKPGDTTMTDFETLKTLTAEQREALVNIIRNSSILDHPLSHLQQALGAPQVLRAQNSSLLQNNINPVSSSIMASNLADFTLSHYAANPIAAMSMMPRRNGGKRRSGNAHNSSWLT
ncbi:unnamed protein product [Heligmosomoides polygyrus]|uniref:Uncharacterized protein n=1 Tax=Heligmosomoides polygyrus TaxID=6339 RepID=A0A183F3Z1_HELPZ|nr:unnamed protein product [Heligmosomoides polygyrus]